MPVVVVGGSSKNVGKTAIVCGLIASFPEFNWTAIKLTSHQYGRSETIWQEHEPGQGTDTARYLAAGAQRSFLVSTGEDEIPITELQSALGMARNVIYESSRVVEYVAPDICLAVIGDTLSGAKPNFPSFLKSANAIVVPEGFSEPIPQLRTGVPIFRRSSADEISPELIAWFKTRLPGLAI